MEEKQGALLPEVYSEAELQRIEAHIETYFGEFANVFHEIVSPDIHVDICIVEPTEARPFYTLVTMGMGAHRMHLPQELEGKGLDRAEVLICLPAHWQVQSGEERWYWPLRWLKIVARLPGEEDSWVGWGHTVPNGGPFAEDTALSGVLIDHPYRFGEEAASCYLGQGEVVQFYQLIPLYEEEMAFKLAHGVEGLYSLWPDGFSDIVEKGRQNYALHAAPPKEGKPFLLSGSEMRPLLQWEGPEGCIATDRILVDGAKVGYCYRERPMEGVPDSGWRFFAGDEDDAYLEDAEKSGIYALNTICNYDEGVIPLLEAPVGTAFYRDEQGTFCEDTGFTLDED